MAEPPEFREFTASRLVLEVAGLLAQSRRNLPDDTFDVPVEFELQDPNGKVLSTSNVMLHVGFGADFDGSGGYQWVKIIAKEER